MSAADANTQGDRIANLEAAIAAAPHTRSCAAAWTRDASCNCWKSRAGDPYRNGESS